MQTKLVTVTSAAGTGNVGYTGVGFQPVGILVLGCKVTPAGDAARALSAFGGGVVGNTVSVQGVSDDAAATSAAGSNRATALVAVRNATGVLRTAGSLVSFDADGFTINWTTVTDQRVFYFLCIGGSDVQMAAGSFTAGAGTGNRSVTGLAFQPNCVIFLDSRISTLATGAEVYWRPMIGFVDSAGNVGSWAGDTWDAQATMVTDRAQSQSACIIQTGDTTGAIDKRATFVSYNSDGFTVNFTTLSGIAVNTYTYYIALQVPFSLVGVTNQRTTTGTTDIATTGFTPKMLLLGGDMTTDTNAGAVDHRFSCGMAAAVAEQAYGCHADQDNVATSNASTGQNSGKALRWIAANGATPTTVVEADISDMSFENFTINYTTVSATANKVMFLAIGDQDAPPRNAAINFQDPGIV